MRRLIILGIVPVTALVIAGALFVALSERAYVSSNSLPADEPVTEKRDPGTTKTDLTFGDDDVNMATEVRIQEAGENLHKVRFVFSHSRNTHLESLNLEFDFGTHNPPISFQQPEGWPWEPVHFQRAADQTGNRTEFDVPDMGFQGTGSVTVAFLLGPYTAEDQEIEQFSVDIGATLSRDGTIQLTDYRADTRVDLPMPGAGES